MNAIEIKGLTKEYDGFKLDNISLVLPSGCIMGLIGENGAGKSTTINSILGVKKYKKGSIKVLGQDMNAKLKNDIGVVLDEVGLPEALNVKNIGTIMRNVYSNWSDDDFNRYINKFSLPENKKFGDFSKGMKMKLAIAIALSHNAKLLILDEPTSGLDPLRNCKRKDFLSDLHRYHMWSFTFDVSLG